MASEELSPSQAHALFDILTHHEAYAEIEGLKKSYNVVNFGAPVSPETPSTLSSPLIQILLHGFVFVLPGLRDVNVEFWSRNVQAIITALDDSNLSESYDKGAVGIRRTLSSAVAASIEYAARGCLGGYARRSVDRNRNYDTSKPEDVAAAWDHFLQETIYGDLLDKLFKKAAETDKLSDHESLVQAAHKYGVAILASSLHYVLVISPRGQSILPLLSRIHNLTPYFLIRQTLRIGNAASMINGMLQLLLAKMNMSTVTSWFGGQPSDSGMNLLQQIISRVLNSDITELKKRLKAIDSSADRPTPEQTEALKAYISMSADQQAELRSKSAASHTSLPAIILSSRYPPLPEPATTAQHSNLLVSLSLHLAVRDRQLLISTLCPTSARDNLTPAIRQLVTAYDPIIRAVHTAVDLSAGTTNLESFLTDLIALVQPILSRSGSEGERSTPSVAEFVMLLEKHAPSSHVFIHQALKNSPHDLGAWYKDYTTHAVQQYKVFPSSSMSSLSSSSSAPNAALDGGAGALSPSLRSLFLSIPSSSQRATVLRELDAHASYLSSLASNSQQRMLNLSSFSFASPSPSPPPSRQGQQGPGIFLYKWQQLMDETELTPGPIEETARKSVNGTGGKALSVRNTIELLGPGFKQILQEKCAETQRAASALP